jgi:hypothetical protein
LSESTAKKFPEKESAANISLKRKMMWKKANFSAFATNFIKVSQIRELLPEASHDVLKLGELRGAAVSLALDNRRS